jgi:peptidoglycan hydrolase-like protein with peptidoglycan-binding domain
VGRHRKRQRKHPLRVSRSVALVSAGLLIPLTGSAVVFAATSDPTRLLKKPAGNGQVPARRAAADARSRVRPQAGGVASSSPLPRTPHTSPPAQASPTARPLLGFAPYADLMAWPPPDLTKLRAKAYTMGFVAADAGCSASWDGLSPVGAASAVSRIKDVPGKVILAFGGPRDVELAQSCDSVGDLAGEYQKAIDAAHPSALDFYLSDSTLSDTSSVQRRTDALVRVQKGHDRPLSITLPLHRSGLPANALGVLRAADAAGLQVAIVNLVPVDDIGGSVTAAATAAHGQLQKLYHQNDAQVWQRMGLTPVIGVAGVGLPFRPADARQLLSWATGRGLGRLSMWSLTRDTPCTVDTNVTDDTCSGLDEDAGVFSKIFRGF